MSTKVDTISLGIYSGYETVLQRGYVKLLISTVAILSVGLYVFYINIGILNSPLLIFAACFAFYMAINIGANDVANNVGPAVGSNALTMFGAIIIAVVFEAGGAFIGGGDVVSTIKKGIIDPNVVRDTKTFLWIMLAALLSGGTWLNIATYFNAPVSTTHSIVGGVLGAGIAAEGFLIVNWGVMGKIAASWFISPVLGGIIGIVFLLFIKLYILYKKDKIAAAKKYVPILISLMVTIFLTYLILKGLKKIVKVEFIMALSISSIIGLIFYFYIKPLLARKAEKLKNTREEVNNMFTLPLIFSAALLSFAHGANDVANAIGPLAAINDALTSAGEINSKVAIPFWVMGIGAIGIGVGLSLYGPKLIRTVGSGITELDKIRAFCVAMSASITVIIASQFGLPVSSTHIAVGAIFGSGFLREILKSLGLSDINSKTHSNFGITFLVKWLKERGITDKGDTYKEYQESKAQIVKLEKERDKLEKKEKKKKPTYIRLHDITHELDELLEKVRSWKVFKQKAKDKKLVKRDALYKIIAAWLITVPATAGISAILFFAIKGIMIDCAL